MTTLHVDIAGHWEVIFAFEVYLGEPGTGFTYTDFKKKRSIVGISESTSGKQMFNTLIHEFKHVQSHICEYFQVDEDSEEAAYLIGYLAEKVYEGLDSLNHILE